MVMGAYWRHSNVSLFKMLLEYIFIHRWCHDIGREQAANKPLLKTVFQVVLCHNIVYSWYIYIYFKYFTFLYFIMCRLWCVYSVLAKQHCFLLSVTKQRSATQSFLESVLFDLCVMWCLSYCYLSMQTPLENLEPILREDIQKVTFYFFLILEFYIVEVFLSHRSISYVAKIPQIWDAVRKPEAHKNTPLSEFFNVRWDLLNLAFLFAHFFINEVVAYGCM